MLMPEPVFHGVFQLVQQRLVGEKHLKMVLKSECGSLTLDGIAFNIDRDLWPNPNVRWSDVRPNLPSSRIEVLGPPTTSGTRDEFMELDGRTMLVVGLGGIGTQVTDRDGNLAPSVSQDLLDLLAAQRAQTDPAARAALL